MPVLSQSPWHRWSPSAVVMAVTVVAVLATGGLELHRLLTVLAEERLYQTREIQEGLSALHRDLQMINHLSAISSEPSEAEARDYVEARREQLGMVRWLGVLPGANERPRVLLASAQMRGYDPRRDPALSPLLGKVEEGTLAATIPGSHRELASLAIVLAPNDSGQSTLVALIDGDDLLGDSLSALTHSDTPLHLMLQGQIVGHWPIHPAHDTPAAEESRPVSVATLNFTLNFGAIRWLAALGVIAQQPLLLLLGGLLLAATVHGRVRPAPPPAAAPTPAPLPAAIPAAEIHRSRLWQLGEMAATLSHDLGQPLNVIRLTAESAQDAAAHNRLEGERLERTLRNTVTQTVRAQAMIDAVVAATRRPSHPPMPVRPVETVRQALAEILPQLRAQGVRLRWHADLSTPVVLGHPPRLGAAVRHLLVNGLEALASRPLDQGPGTLSVECRPDGDGDGVVIVIADDGPGFPPMLLSQLNDPLPAMIDRRMGRGLGLTISLGVAAEMGATLSIADGFSEEGEPGTRVTLALPPARRSLLLVEDDIAAASELAEYLSAKGWLVHHCPGGNPALALFREHGADAVVTDLHMSDGDGWQLIERLHALAPDLPIIAMSTADGEDARRAVAAGAALILRKPVSLCDLYDELDGLFCESW